MEKKWKNGLNVKHFAVLGIIANVDNTRTLMLKIKNQCKLLYGVHNKAITTCWMKINFKSTNNKKVQSLVSFMIGAHLVHCTRQIQDGNFTIKN